MASPKMTAISKTKKDERVHSELALAASDDANEFDAVAFGQGSLYPFVSMNGDTVMLDQN
jgi:hypothetical protein